MIIRDAIADDMRTVCDLYNTLISTTTVAWTETLERLEDRLAWFEQQRNDGNAVLVADTGADVVGFASYGSFRGAGKWPGYQHTVEHTIHVRADTWGVGVGRLLLCELIDRAQRSGIHVMVGAIDGGNSASIAFHERLGFVVVARMPEVGRKFERWLDLVLMQRIIEP